MSNYYDMVDHSIPIDPALLAEYEQAALPEEAQEHTDEGAVHESLMQLEHEVRVLLSWLDVTLH
jgi:hypothetical protein